MPVRLHPTFSCFVVGCAVLALLSACSSGSRGPAAGRDGPGDGRDVSQVPDAVPRVEPRSRGGNPASYVVFGKRYYTMDSSAGYRKRGIASWYGSKFHGRRTSNGEVYDMYAMSAAHKELPIPTYVEVTNLENVVNEFLDYTREIRLEIRPVDVGQFFSELLATYGDWGHRKIGVHLGIYNRKRIAAPLFRTLEEDREQIEAELGFAVEWRKNKNSGSFSLVSRLHDCDPLDECDWQRQHEWLASHLTTMWRVLEPRIDTFQPLETVESAS